MKNVLKIKNVNQDLNQKNAALFIQEKWVGNSGSTQTFQNEKKTGVPWTTFSWKKLRDKDLEKSICR